MLREILSKHGVEKERAKASSRVIIFIQKHVVAVSIFLMAKTPDLVECFHRIRVVN
jgi:hypothetical protein